MHHLKMNRPINWQFIRRALILMLLVVLVAVIGISQLPPPLLSKLVMGAARTFGPTPAPTPLLPTIDIPVGPQPAGPVGLEEWPQYQGGNYERIGSGFLLKTENAIVGVTTAHSIQIGQPVRLLEHVAFRIPGQDAPVVICDTLYGAPGIPADAQKHTNLSIDYVLLKVETDAVISPELLLEPDPRGLPQPGERVILYSGLGDGQGNPLAIYGTAQAADEQSVWALMDGSFEPGMMSGSPLLSAHTGKVVGMAIAVTPRRQYWLMGFHPINSIVEHVANAADFPLIADYQP